MVLVLLMTMLYSDVFIPYIKKQLETSIQIDVVWDSYVTCSIKESTDAIFMIVGKFVICFSNIQLQIYG